MTKKYLRIAALLFLSGCAYDNTEDMLPEKDLVAASGFPTDVGNILVKKCATAGCHNSESRGLAGGLDFSTWEMMFDGGRNGTSVIPYSVDNSYMLYSVNTDTTRGPVLVPTMPYLQAPLSDAEYNTLADWIANGAKNKDGFVKFSDDPERRKIYVTMQGCDKVAVMDAKTKVIMRYIDVGNTPTIEAPHLVRVSPDRQYWYVVFLFSNVVQKFRTADDSFVAEVVIGSGDWNTLIFSPDGKRGYVNGTVVNTTMVLDLENMQVLHQLSFDNPHGGFVSLDGNTLYLTAQFGNFIHKINLSDFDATKIVLQPGQPASSTSLLDPHEMILSPDGSKYFVTCQKSNEVRVMRTSDDSLLAVISVGANPQEFSLSLDKPYLFVTCTEAAAGPNQKGQVYMINYNDLSIVSTVYTGYQPHGVAVDDEEGLVYVANLNYDQTGPAPHHASSCSGRNGYMTIIDLNTLQLWRKTLSDGSDFQYRCELLSFPYFVDLRK